MRKKQSARFKIYVLLRKYGIYILTIPLACIALWYSFKFIGKCFSGGFGWFGGILAVALLTIWGTITAIIIAPRLGGSFGDFFYSPKIYLKTPPDILSPIKGMIARKEYEDAIEKLNELLAKKPFSPEPYLILVETYAHELNDYLRTMALIEEYFAQKKVYPFDENIDMLLLYADICHERNYLHKAERLLEQEIARKGYLDIKRKSLQTRLEAIRTLENKKN